MKKTIYYIIFLSTLMMSSCSDWLDVKPSNNEEEEEMFSTETGFENALTGVYINMKSHQLYGRQLTMGMLEYMAQHWVANSSTTEGRYSNYDYEDAAVEESIKNIYAGLYNVLLNVNNLLRFIDNGVLSGKKHDLIKGEALGLRAFCHLDLLRLFGPIPGTQDDRKLLTYSKAVSKNNLPVNTWTEYVASLKQDLDEAELLLKNVETKSHEDSYFTHRQNRMNYWAVLAIKARFYLWLQDHAQAKKYAQQVINSHWRSLCQKEDIVQNKDYIASKEHLFSLHVYNLEELAERFIYQAGGVYMPERYIKKELFASDVTDVRVNTLWKQVTETSRTRFILMKYKQGSEIAKYSAEQIPLIRIYEMYLIAIECSESPNEYKPLVDELLKVRNVSRQVNVDTSDGKMAFVTSEYNKEFYGEGQQFFQYKRRGERNILWTNKEGSKSVYVLPLPKTELKYQ